MGISGLKKLLPSRPINAWEFLGCGGPQQTRQVAIDAANPLMACLSRHPKHAFAGDYEPALMEWRHLLEAVRARGVKAVMVFDGQRYAAKANESARRSSERESYVSKIEAALERGEEPLLSHYASALHINDAVSLLAMKVCEHVGQEFVVAPFEADPQLAALRDAARRPLPVISADTDMLALGVNEWIVLDHAGWYTGAATLFAPGEWAVDPDYPLVALHKRLGREVFAYMGALVGCDFTVARCGVYGVGAELAIDTLSAASALTASAVTAALSAQIAAGKGKRLRDAERAALVDGTLAEEIARAVGGFELASHYTADGRIVLLLQADTEVEATTPEAVAHRRGQRCPRTGGAIDGELKAKVDGLDPARLALNNLRAAATGPVGQSGGAVGRSGGAVSNSVLPKPVNDCSVAELQGFIAAHGGSVTGMNRPELVARARHGGSVVGVCQYVSKNDKGSSRSLPQIARRP